MVRRRRLLGATFARVLREHRRAKRLSQEKLANFAGVDRTYVGLIERGLRTPTIDAAHLLAQALGTKLSELIREVERRL
jgi:transcriptional regulator with XRE-family HTH domain